jgi:psiF repeat
MKLSALASVAVLAVALSAGAAFAQTTAPAAGETTTMTPAARSAKSVECSKEADAKGLHGAERKKFRAKCKEGKM